MRTINGFDPAGLSVLPFVICDPDGRIVRTGVAPSAMIEQQALQNEVALVGEADQVNQYIDLSSGQTINKSSMSPVINGLNVSGLPSPCFVFSDGVSTEVVGGEVSFEYSQPGTYFVEVMAKHYFSCGFEVTQP